MTDEITLLPCPFCGGDELMVFCDPEEARDNSGPSRRIQCGDCHIEAPFYETKAEAIAAWNRRASQDAPASDGLREALETIRDGYGPNHLSKFALAIASAALSTPTQGGAA